MSNEQNYKKVTIIIEELVADGEVAMKNTITIPRATGVTFGQQSVLEEHYHRGFKAFAPVSEMDLTLEAKVERDVDGSFYKIEQDTRNMNPTKEVEERWAMEGFVNAPDEYLKTKVHPEWCTNREDHEGHRVKLWPRNGVEQHRWCGGYTKPE